MQLERLDLIGGVARGHPREWFAGRLAPHAGGDEQPVSQRDRIHGEKS
jgi:hypothetical protein